MQLHYFQRPDDHHVMNRSHILDLRHNIMIRGNSLVFLTIPGRMSKNVYRVGLPMSICLFMLIERSNTCMVANDSLWLLERSSRYRVNSAW